MKEYLKKGIIILVAILVYFTAWRAIRSFVTAVSIIPQIEYAISSCNEYLQYEQVKPTSLRIYLYDWERKVYDVYSYTTPAGFYLLAGLLILIWFNSSSMYYLFLVGYHMVFWVLSTVTLLPGLCVHPVFLHLTFLGIQYLNSFITFAILIILISPGMRKTFSLRDK